jgi:hypothetical protein
MAIFTKQALRVHNNHDPYLSVLFREALEGAGQTFLEDWPLKIAAGLYVEWVNPGDADIAAFAAQAATGTTSEKIVVILAEPSKILVEANFLGAAGIDNALAQADFGISRDLEKLATLINGTDPGWYIEDAAAAAAVKIQSPRNAAHGVTTESDAVAGDTNARVRARLLDSVCHWNA